MTDERRYTDRHYTAQPLYPPQAPATTRPGQPSDRQEPKRHGSHRLMMILCCVPMLLVVGFLLATGAAGSGNIIFALICMAMMMLMMAAMPGGHRH